MSSLAFPMNRPPRLVARASVLADLVLAAQGEEGAAAGAGRPPPQLL